MTAQAEWSARREERGSKDWLKLGGAGLLVAIAAFAAATPFVEPAPPSRIAISAGEPGGAYTLFAHRYRESLARHGIELEVHTSAGSVDNLGRLLSGEVDVALVQGGTAAGKGEGLLSLGSVFFEPLWVFHRRGLDLVRLSELRGRRLAVGPLGSGTRAVALQLLAANGADRPPTQLIELGAEPAAEELLAGALDACFLIASPRSAVVRRLLEAEEVELMSFARAPAYARVHRFLSELTLPEGAIDLAANVPRHATSLLAPAANLVVRESFHPALVDLLLQAAAEVHGEPGLFSEPGQFPAPRYLEFPLSREARRYYEVGPPFLQRYLPFWAATQVDRLKVMLVPLIALLLPLLRVFPPVYRWRVRSRIYRWYKELRRVDPDPDEQGRVDHLAERFAEVARIEGEVRQLPTPLSYAEELYDLRLHIELVRGKLEAARPTDEPE